MSPVLTVETVDRTDWLEHATLQIQDSLGARSTLRASIGGDDVDDTPWVPADDDTIVVTDEIEVRDGETVSLEDRPIFGGFVLTPNRGHRGLMSRVSAGAVGYEAAADDVHVTESFEAGQTLKTILTALASHLPASVTLDPAMPDGPAIASPVVWTDQLLSKCWADLVTLCGGGWAPKIGHDGVQRLIELGAQEAPWSITDAEPNLIEEPTCVPRRDTFANRVIQPYGSGDVWTAEQQAADGVTRMYPVQHPVASRPPHVSIDGLPYPLFEIGDPFAYEWAWDPAAGDHGAIVQDPAYPVLTPPHVVSWEYSARYPDRAIAENAADIAARERAIDFIAPAIAEVVSAAQAQAMADGYLARRGAMPREFRGRTDRSGLAPGQRISIQWSPVGLTEATDFTVTDVTYRQLAAAQAEWSFVAVEGTIYPGSHLDIYRQWTAGGGGGGGGSVSAPAFPVTAAAVASVYLGGSRSASQAQSAGVWTPVLDYLTYVSTASFAARVGVDLWARHAGVGVKARLYNVTDGTAVESAQVTATVATAVTFGVSIVAGKTYRLEVVAAVDGSAYAIGSLWSL